jgi:hypothetical protein
MLPGSGGTAMVVPIQREGEMEGSRAVETLGTYRQYDSSGSCSGGSESGFHGVRVE